MPIPTESTYFEPRDTDRFYAAQGALFLVDPIRLHEMMGDGVFGSDLIKTLTRKPEPHRLYLEGAIVPALGVEQSHFTVTLRSSETRNAHLALSHMLFSTGFVLGTETGDLLLCNTDRLQHWNPGQPLPGKEEYSLSSFERPFHISPGWYSTTVVTGMVDDHGSSVEQWLCAFLLDPKPARPPFVADLTLPLCI